MLNSEMKDKNGVDIKDGDTVRIVMQQYVAVKITRDCEVRYLRKRAAFVVNWHKDLHKSVEDWEYLGAFNMGTCEFEVIRQEGE